MAAIVLSKLNKHYGAVFSRREGRRSRDRRPGVRGAGRPVGLRQVDDLAHDRRPRGHFQRRDPHRRAGGQPPAAARPRRRHGVPELRALSAHERLRQSGLRAAQQEDARKRDQGGDRPRRRDAGPARAPEAQAAPALGRPAAARGAGPLHRAQSAGLPVRRAAQQPRRQAARPDAHRDQAPARPAADHLGVRDPRPGRSHDPGRPRGGDARRPRPAGRHAARGLQQAGQQVRRRFHRRAGHEFPRRHDPPRKATRWWPSRRR